LSWSFDDIYNSIELNIDVLLNEGNHVLELYGAEGCCDGPTSWEFSINWGDWIPFTTTNLNMFRYPIPEEPDLCTAMDGWE
jgi:hypothetical protein